MRFVRKAANVVADDFAEDFVHHRHIGLAVDVISELGLYH